MNVLGSSLFLRVCVVCGVLYDMCVCVCVPFFASAFRSLHTSLPISHLHSTCYAPHHPLLPSNAEFHKNKDIDDEKEVSRLLELGHTYKTMLSATRLLSFAFFVFLFPPSSLFLCFHSFILFLRLRTFSPSFILSFRSSARSLPLSFFPSCFVPNKKNKQNKSDETNKQTQQTNKQTQQTNKQKKQINKQTNEQKNIKNQTNKQTNKQTTKKTTKQSKTNNKKKNKKKNKQTNKQTNKHKDATTNHTKQNTTKDLGPL